MAETLFIRLGSHTNELIHWLIKTNGQDEIIASGELPQANELTQLTEKARTRDVVVFVPACDVSFNRLNVPGNSARAIRQAAPYMLEDDLAQDVEAMFFAYGDVKTDDAGHNCFVAGVTYEQIKQWQHCLTQADIFCKVMIPDALALPQVNGKATAILLSEQVLLKQGDWQAMAIDVNLWSILAPQLLAENRSEHDEQKVDAEQTLLSAYSPLPASEELNVEYLPEELPLALLADNHDKKLNLLQGEFQVKEKRSSHYRNWLWAASFAAVALILNFVLKGTELHQLSAQQEHIEQQIIQQYKTTFPKTKRVKVATIRSQLKQKMKEVGGSHQGAGFLTLMIKVEPALASVNEIKPQSLKFDGKRQEIRLQAYAQDYQYFEKFKNALEKQGLTVNLGAQNNQGDQISGSFSIVDSKTKERS